MSCSNERRVQDCCASCSNEKRVRDCCVSTLFMLRTSLQTINYAGKITELWRATDCNEIVTVT